MFTELGTQQHCSDKVFRPKLLAVALCRVPTLLSSAYSLPGLKQKPELDTSDNCHTHLPLVFQKAFLAKIMQIFFLFNNKLLTNYGLEGPFNHKYLLSTPFPTDSSSSLCPCLLSTVLPYTILCPLLSSVIHLSYSVICPHLFLLCHHLSF